MQLGKLFLSLAKVNCQSECQKSLSPGKKTTALQQSSSTQYLDMISFLLFICYVVDVLCWTLHTDRIVTSAKEVMFLPDFVCLSVSQQDNSKSYGRIFLKFWGHVGNGKNYQWFNFGGDLKGILDSGSLWNFRYHCFQWGVREPLANRRWCCHLVNNIALAEVCRLWLLSS